MLSVLIDTVIDTIKIIPFLFVAYLLIEFLEQKAEEKTTKWIQKYDKFGPLLGGFLGIVPQCGFSAAAANLYGGKIITMGTIIAVFLSTSDEMLPILISESVPSKTILTILLIKVFIAILVGTTVDLIFAKKHQNTKKEIHKLCDNEHCHCEEEGILKSTLKHTLHILIYIFAISLVLNFVIYFIGENRIANFIAGVPILGTAIATLIGLIPNCASSVVLTELYVSHMISAGTMIAGLLVNSGIGLLVLFRVNNSKKENFTILSILYVTGLIAGILLDLVL